MSCDPQSDEYEKNGYAQIKEAAPPLVAKTLLNIIHSQMTVRPDVLRSFLSTRTITEKKVYDFYSYKNPAVLGFHWGLTSRMVQVTGKRLLPTYAYFQVYQQGDILKVHSDRQSCEHSFSMALAYSDDIVWPFEIEKHHYSFDDASKLQVSNDFGGADYQSLSLAPGDAVLYKGCNHRHGRLNRNPNRWSAHIFLHWVDQDGPFAEWAFDKYALPPGGDFLFPKEQDQ